VEPVIFIYLLILLTGFLHRGAHMSFSNQFLYTDGLAFFKVVEHSKYIHCCWCFLCFAYRHETDSYTNR